MTDRWSFLAQKQGLRARSYFKLEEMDKKFSLFKNKSLIIDMGSAPGGWSLYSRSVAHSGARVIAIDKQKMNPIHGVDFFHGDESVLYSIVLNNPFMVDLFLSDMSPKTCGDSDIDSNRLATMLVTVMDIVVPNLKKGGDAVLKFFENESVVSELSNYEKEFLYFKIYKPHSSRQSSKEKYLIYKSKKA